MKTDCTKDKIRFNEILLATKRDGVEYVIEELEHIGFYDAPASGSHHLCKAGGLVMHSLNVYDEAMALAGHYITMRPELKNLLHDDSIAISGLLHDVCKADIYKKTVRSRKSIDGSWEKFDCFEAGHSSFPCGHGEKSVIQLLRWGLELTEDEMLAIRWHMGPWELAYQSLDQTASIERSVSMYPLVGIIQSADFLASNILEGGH